MNLRSLCLLLYAAMPSLAAAAESTTRSRSGTAGGGFWLVWLVGYLTRKRPIGGWLMAYYWMLYGSVLFTLAAQISVQQNFQPEQWEDRALYTLFLISIVPLLIAYAAEVVFATRLLFHRYRSDQSVLWLKRAMMFKVACFAVAILIDYFHFPEDIVWDVIPLIPTLLWLGYFRNSLRVEYVFKRAEQGWNYEAFQKVSKLS